MARQLVTASTAQAIAQGLPRREALAARGRPEAAVREALKLKWAALPEAERRPAEADDMLALDLYHGRLRLRRGARPGARGRRRGEPARGRSRGARRACSPRSTPRPAARPTPRAWPIATSPGAKAGSPTSARRTTPWPPMRRRICSSPPGDPLGKPPRADLVAKRAEWRARVAAAGGARLPALPVGRTASPGRWRPPTTRARGSSPRSLRLAEPLPTYLPEDDRGGRGGPHVPPGGPHGRGDAPGSSAPPRGRAARRSYPVEHTRAQTLLAGRGARGEGRQ